LGAEEAKITCFEPLDTFAIIPDQIVEIIPAGREDVFDIEVERTENFIANGVVSHNTRWHEDDLTGRLREAHRAGTGDEWFELHLPAIDDDGDALWPEYWPLAELDKARRADSRVWQAQYQGDPTPGEGGTIKRHWLIDYDVQPINSGQIEQSLDTAFETGDINDWSVCTTWAYGPGGQYLLDVYRERVEYPDLERMGLSLYRQYRPAAVLVEQKASGQSLIQSLRRAGIPVIGIPVPTDKTKVYRVHEAAPAFEAGWVHLPGMATWREATIKELIEFPLGKHDDVVDSVVQSVKWIRERMDDAGEWSGSILPRAQDDEEDEEDYLWHHRQRRRR
jgi:predicted phage terminase large subunit-like protein